MVGCKQKLLVTVAQRLITLTLASPSITAWLLSKECTSESDIPSLDEVMQMRTNEKMFCEFYEFMIVPMIGRATLFNLVQTKGKVRNDALATSSDEAFALVILDNYYERWKDVAAKNNFKLPPRMHKCKSNKKRAGTSNVTAKYTTGGIYTGKFC